MSILGCPDTFLKGFHNLKLAELVVSAAVVG